MIYWGDSRLKHRVVFEKNSQMKCIYCGDNSKTREHSPSKVFLTEPYPLNLPTVPACEKCNNNFSSDEVYSAILIRLLNQYFYDIEPDLDDQHRLTRKEGKEAKQFFNDNKEKPNEIHNERLERVLIKLARSHAVYDMSEGYNASYVAWKEDLQYFLKPCADNKTISEFDVPEEIKIIPEIGSKICEKICILESRLKNSDKELILNVPLVPWTEIQENKYKYICFPKEEDICVKIIIENFLYAKVVFHRIKTDS